MSEQATTKSKVRAYNLMQAELLANPEQLEIMTQAAEDWILARTPETPPVSREMAEDLVKFMFDLHPKHIQGE